MVVVCFSWSVSEISDATSTLTSPRYTDDSQTNTREVWGLQITCGWFMQSAKPTSKSYNTGLKEAIFMERNWTKPNRFSNCRTWGVPINNTSFAVYLNLVLQALHIVNYLIQDQCFTGDLVTARNKTLQHLHPFTNLLPSHLKPWHGLKLCDYGGLKLWRQVSYSGSSSTLSERLWLSVAWPLLALTWTYPSEELLSSSVIFNPPLGLFCFLLLPSLIP